MIQKMWDWLRVSSDNVAVACDAPVAPPASVLALTGPYSDFVVSERGGRLWALCSGSEPTLIDTFNVDGLWVGGVFWPRREKNFTSRICPVRPVVDVVEEARSAAPPLEEGRSFRPSQLIDPSALDSSLRVDLRYASENNFLGFAFYGVGSRALLQRCAAEAVVRAHCALRSRGFGLCVLDAYRPWFVTKAFWEATPPELRWLVADPASGSKHNRGCAVDVTLYRLQGGEEVDMPSEFDESTARAHAFYPGGSELQRWHRAVLRQAMEAQGFRVNEKEWWHFDFQDWTCYAIENVDVR